MTDDSSLTVIFLLTSDPRSVDQSEIGISRKYIPEMIRNQIIKIKIVRQLLSRCRTLMPSYRLWLSVINRNWTSVSIVQMVLTNCMYLSYVCSRVDRSRVTGRSRSRILIEIIFVVSKARILFQWFGNENV